MNLVTIIEPHPDDAPALVFRGDVVTYGQLRQRVGAVQAGLVERAVAPGDRVAIVVANAPSFVFAYLGALAAGAVAVPLNPTSPPPELDAQLARVGANVVIASAADVDDLVGAGGGAPAPAPVDRADDDLAALLFTSGTAGAPKAAMLSHGNLRTNLEQAQRHPGRALTAADVSLGVLPMFHIFGLNVVLGLSLHSGGSIVLVERFDPASTLDLVRDHKITVLAGAPPLFATLATMPGTEAEQRGDNPLASVRLALTGAAPLPEEVAAAFDVRFGITLRQGYGLTEASPIVTSALLDGPARPSSIGVPLPGVDVRLVDADGEDALAGDAGEIWVRGGNVFKGYWEDAAATADVLTPDGWLRTGDIAVADDDGYLYLVDRAKDVVIVSGFNVFPAEVEAVLLSHPDVVEAAVVGVAHPHTGEAVKAFVVAAPGRHLEEDQLTEFVAARLARYKSPSTITFVPELPHGLSGKVLRRQLSELTQLPQPS